MPTPAGRVGQGLTGAASEREELRICRPCKEGDTNLRAPREPQPHVLVKLQARPMRNDRWLERDTLSLLKRCVEDRQLCRIYLPYLCRNGGCPRQKRQQVLCVENAAEKIPLLPREWTRCYFSKMERKFASFLIAGKKWLALSEKAAVLLLFPASRLLAYNLRPFLQDNQSSLGYG